MASSEPRETFLRHVLGARLAASHMFCDPAEYRFWQSIGQNIRGDLIVLSACPQIEESRRHYGPSRRILKLATAWELVHYAGTQWSGQSRVLALGTVWRRRHDQALHVPRLDPGRQLVSVDCETDNLNGALVLCAVLRR